MCTREGEAPPAIVDPDADQRFRDLATRLCLDPDARYVGGYVGWEWAHARHVFDGLVAPVRGEPVLEVGCNVGATAIVLAALGAEVTAVDPDARYLELARANAARHGVEERIAFVHVADTTRMPFERGRFDWVTCNSVLEYVAPSARSRACSRRSTACSAPAASWPSSARATASGLARATAGAGS